MSKQQTLSRYHMGAYRALCQVSPGNRGVSFGKIRRTHNYVIMEVVLQGGTMIEITLRRKSASPLFLAGCAVAGKKENFYFFSDGKLEGESEIFILDLRPKQ